MKQFRELIALRTVHTNVNELCKIKSILAYVRSTTGYIS